MDAALSPLQLLGFLLAAWAVIGNDSLQTLGPFLEANRGRTSRWLQSLVLCALLCAVLLLGWWRSGGDPSWGRLAAYPEPAGFGWVELLPPLAVLLLTQAGVPVSTSFLVLTAFTPANLPLLLQRSLLGYGLALLVGLLLFGVVSLLRRDQAEAQLQDGGARPGADQRADPAHGALMAAPAVRAAQSVSCSPAGPRPSPPQPEGTTAADSGELPPAVHTLSEPGDRLSRLALLLQWLASGWLWSQWLIQDMANVFIYLPRRLGGGVMALALVVLCLGVSLLLAENGGAIQQIVRRKSGLGSPSASAALSLVYGLILALLARRSSDPLSTTWVFLGLLAGRELALQLMPQARPLPAVVVDLGRDLALASLGLAVSVGGALLLQPLRGML